MTVVRTPPAERMVLSTGPAAEPVSATDAKKHLEISGAAHDYHVSLLIEAARQQWEHDTQEYLINQTWTLTTDSLMELRYPKRPVSSITSITYYDSGNSQQTLATSVYALDTADNTVRLKVDQSWPTVYERYDAVTHTVVLGDHSAATTVPAVAKQAMLLLIGNYFEDREMMAGAMGNDRAYQALVRRYTRSSYP